MSHNSKYYRKKIPKNITDNHKIDSFFGLSTSVPVINESEPVSPVNQATTSQSSVSPGPDQATTSVSPDQATISVSLDQDTTSVSHDQDNKSIDQATTSESLCPLNSSNIEQLQGSTYSSGSSSE